MIETVNTDIAKVLICQEFCPNDTRYYSVVYGQSLSQVTKSVNVRHICCDEVAFAFQQTCLKNWRQHDQMVHTIREVLQSQSSLVFTHIDREVFSDRTVSVKDGFSF